MGVKQVGQVDLVETKADTVPKAENILRVFEISPKEYRVLILGQDPYPTPGHAVGLAFALLLSTTSLAQERRFSADDLPKIVRIGDPLVDGPRVPHDILKVLGVEALLRWTNPALGQIPPGEFIPIAEDTGLINDIGRWVLRESCRVAKHWPENLNVAVNLSPAQFTSGDMPKIVQDTLAFSGIEAGEMDVAFVAGDDPATAAMARA